VKLSGDFEEMNTRTGKFQNQSIDIELKPMFSIFLWKAEYEKVLLYDAYNKNHYHFNIITLTNHPELFIDSICRKEIEIQSRLIDSASNIPLTWFRRAASYASLKNYNNAFSDYDSALSLDSSFILVYFSRANSRYDLIQFIQSLDNKEDQISIGINTPKGNKQISSKDLENTYEMVNQDFTRAIEIDSQFYFAYYNRGVVNCKIGNYKQAIDDFSEAIQCRDNFAEAIYNRGLIYILLNENQKGCEDLSRAGELGILDAYKVMKRYCFKQ
jgi:tetratricopeptide (TPR) repeat protein